jgi:hypothetical protein
MANSRDRKETKNIPKNFSKAIITYVIKNQHLCRRILGNDELNEGFIEYLKKRKRIMSNIKHLSDMLIDTPTDGN